MNEPTKSNTGVIVAVIAGALIVVGGISWNQHDSERRAAAEAHRAQVQKEIDQYNATARHWETVLNNSPK